MSVKLLHVASLTFLLSIWGMQQWKNQACFVFSSKYRKEVDLDFGFVICFVILLSVALKSSMLFVLQISDISFEELLLTSALCTILEEKQSRKKIAASTYRPLVSQWCCNTKERRERHGKPSLHGLPLPFREIGSCHSGDVRVQLNSHPHRKKINSFIPCGILLASLVQ